MSLRDLEARAGVANSEISKIEAGDQDCRLESFIKISAALGVPFGKILDDVVLSDFTFYHGQLMGDAQFLKLTESYTELRSVIAQNLAMIAAWAAHLIRCGHPVTRSRGVVYPSVELCSAFVSFGDTVDHLDSPASRRALADSLSTTPFSCLWQLGLVTGTIIQHLVDRLLGGKNLWFDLSLLEQLGLRAPGLLWFPFVPREFNAPACPSPSYGSIVGVDNLRETVNSPLVTPTWEQTIELARAATTEPGTKGKLAEKLGVPQSRLSEWLGGKYEPGAAVAFRLAAEVGELMKAKSKSVTNVLASATPTASKKDKRDESPKSKPRKRSHKVG